MKHTPERTCIGCRSIFSKDDVIRIVAGPIPSSGQAPTVSGQAGIAIDYREKLPGRAAYICPTRSCIRRGLQKDLLSKALRTKVRTPSEDEFIAWLTGAIEEKIKSLIVMSAKAGKLAAGYSAVHDALEKGRVDLLLVARDISAGTLGKVNASVAVSIRRATLFTRDELGGLLNRELVGVLGIEDKGLSQALWRETERLKDLINAGE